MSTTAADLSEEQLKRYRPFHRDKKPGLSSGAKKVAAQIAKELGEPDGARKVFLFGSLARGDQGSLFDIDLAAKGYFRFGFRSRCRCNRPEPEMEN